MGSQKFSPAARILSLCSRRVGTPDYPGGTTRTNVDNALDFVLKVTPDFLDIVKGKRVLDVGCGFGYQAAALARDWNCDVTGLDLPRPVLMSNWPKMAALSPRVRFVTEPPEGDVFDVVFSCSSFEHFEDPEGILRLMIERAAPGGRVVVAFAEPWFSPHGSHMNSITRLPWVNLLFPESAVLSVRSKYRSDGATRYEEVEGGLNRMTVAKFERIVKACGLPVERLNCHAVKGLPLVTRIPVLRELLTSAASCVLVKPLA